MYLVGSIIGRAVLRVVVDLGKGRGVLELNLMHNRSSVGSQGSGGPFSWQRVVAGHPF